MEIQPIADCYGSLPPEKERVFYRGVPKSAYELVKKNYTSGKRIHWSGISSISDAEPISIEFALSEGAAKGDDGPGGVVSWRCRRLTLSNAGCKNSEALTTALLTTGIAFAGETCGIQQTKFMWRSWDVAG